VRSGCIGRGRKIGKSLPMRPLPAIESKTCAQIESGLQVSEKEGKLDLESAGPEDIMAMPGTHGRHTETMVAQKDRHAVLTSGADANGRGIRRGVCGRT
jgi:hypothetical protein